MTLFQRHWRAILVGFAAAAIGGLLTLGLDDTEATIFSGAALAAIGDVLGTRRFARLRTWLSVSR